MKIPTTVLLSAVLVVTSLTTMAMPTFNANITNFPLDEQGNLKVGMQEEPLQTYKDSVEIALLQSDQGITISYVPDMPWGDCNHPLTLAFAFSSKPRFLNVTDLWLSILIHEVKGDLNMEHYQLDLVFNGNLIHHIDEEIRATGNYHIISVQVLDENIHKSIVPSVGTLTLANPEVYRSGAFRYYHWKIYRLTMFIEYEYQA